MANRYAECRKSHRNKGGKSDGCQKFTVEKWDLNSDICDICRCHRNFHPKAEPLKPPDQYKTEVVCTKCHKIHDFKFQNSMDRCKEFIPSGKKDTSGSLTCAICGCHKGFNRNEITTKELSFELNHQFFKSKREL